MQHIEEKEVLHIADLCALPLKPEEITSLSSALSDTLEYIQILESLDTSKVPETFQVTGLENVFQSDRARTTSLSQKEALSNAKKTSQGKFTALAVFNR